MNGNFRVGEFLIEPNINSISGTEKTVRLEPKVMRVLVCLAENAGEVLPKDKLIQSVWPDAFVTDDVLTRSTSELRKVFKDEAREPRFIQTIPRSGYRLIAPVSCDVVKEIETDLPVQVPAEITATARKSPARLPKSLPSEGYSRKDAVRRRLTDCNPAE